MLRLNRWAAWVATLVALGLAAPEAHAQKRMPATSPRPKQMPRPKPPVPTSPTKPKPPPQKPKPTPVQPTEPGRAPTMQTPSPPRVYPPDVATEPLPILEGPAVPPPVVAPPPVESVPLVRGVPDTTTRIAKLEVLGLESTRYDVILDLLPRDLPTDLEPFEIEEFQRRVGNLELFDDLEVGVRSDVLVLSVREKSTLTPLATYTGGRTVEDTEIAVGLVESNLFGTAAHLGGAVYWADRALNANLNFNSNPYRPRDWTVSGHVLATGSLIRFPSSRANWERRRWQAELELNSPFPYGTPLRFLAGPVVYWETSSSVEGNVRPADGLFSGATIALFLDLYRWHDLTPSGVLISVGLTPGYFWGASQLRLEGKLEVTGSLPLWTDAALMSFMTLTGVNEGNANNSVLFGSQAGVRGLSDNLYRSRTIAYGNFEIRHSIRFTDRWALQLVPFADVGAFDGMDPRGNATGWDYAYGVGGGLRLVPTQFSDILLRIDGAHSFHPEVANVVLSSFSQYF